MGLEQLSSLASRLRAVASMGARVAAAAAPELLELVKASAAAGTTADGQAWAPRRKDGARALAKAPEQLSVSVVGDVVVLALNGFKYVYNSRRRHILPEAGAPLPSSYVDVIRKHARAVMRGTA